MTLNHLSNRRARCISLAFRKLLSLSVRADEGLQTILGFPAPSRVNRFGFPEGAYSCETGGREKRTPLFLPEVRERAVRTLFSVASQGSTDALVTAEGALGKLRS